MMLGDLVNQVTQQLSFFDEHVQLIIVHPNCMYLHMMLDTYQVDDIAYVRFEGHNLTLKQIQSQYNDFLKTQMNGNLSSVLILDECDRAQEKNLAIFIKEIIKSNPVVRVFMFTRKIPRYILNDSEIRPFMRFVPNNHALMFWDYTQTDKNTDLLEVRAFGEGHITLNGRDIDQWSGVLPRALFFYLVDRGMVTRTEIFETFWPNLSLKEATNVFHVTKRKVNEVIGSNLMVYRSGFYTISPKFTLNYDVILFTQMAQKSAVSGDTTLAISFLRQALSLYKRQFLHTLDMDWVQDRRRELDEDFNNELESLAQMEFDIGNKEVALGLYLQAMANANFRSRIAVKIIRIYQELGLLSEALELYESVKTEDDPILHELGQSIYLTMMESIS